MFKRKATPVCGWQIFCFLFFVLCCKSHHMILCQRLWPKLGMTFSQLFIFQGDKDDMGLLNKGGLTRLSYQSLTVHTPLVTFVKVFLSSETHSLKEPCTSKEMCGRKPRLHFCGSSIYAPQAKYIYFERLGSNIHKPVCGLQSILKHNKFHANTIYVIKEKMHTTTSLIHFPNCVKGFVIKWKISLVKIY